MIIRYGLKHLEYPKGPVAMDFWGNPVLFDTREEAEACITEKSDPLPNYFVAEYKGQVKKVGRACCLGGVWIEKLGRHLF